MDWKIVVSRMVVVDRQANLLEIVAAAHASGCLACGLYGGEQQAHQYADDRDHDKEFHQREPSSPFSVPLHLMPQ